MPNRTIGIIATVLTTLLCGCGSLLSCIWGFMIASGTPINVTVNGTTTPQTFSPTIGYTLLCLSLFLLLVPAAVGLFTLRRKPGSVDVIPPARPFS